MATGGQSFIESFTAGADLSLFRYRAVRLSADNTVNVASNITASTFLGVLDNDPKSGEAAAVVVEGLTRIAAGGNITAGAVISHNASGFAVASASGSVIIGRALEAGAAGQIISALIQSPSMQGY